MNRLHVPRITGCMAVWLAFAVAILTPVSAEEVEVQTVAEGLTRPCDLALRLGGSRSGPNLMVAEGDTHRVLGLSTTDFEGGLVEVVEPAADDANWGDARLVFRSRNRMLVGQAAADGSALRIIEFDIDDDALPLSRDEQKLRYEYEPESGSVELTGMTRESSTLVVATGQHQWLLKGTLRTGPPTKLKSFVRSEDVTEFGTPRAVKFSQKGYLVVVESGPASATESMLVFYHPVDITSEPLLKLPIELTGIVSLAYSTTTGSLYVASQSPEPAESGVYRLDAQFNASTGEQSCEAVRVVELDDPTALVFDDAGALFIATAGTAGEADGRLLRIAPGL